MRTTAIIVAASIVAGTGVAQAEDIAVDQLPAAVVAAATAAEGAIIVEAERDDDDGKVVYEVEVRVGLGDKAFEIAEDGTVLSLEEEIDPAELPAAVVATATTREGAVIVAAEREEEEGEVEYTVEVRAGLGEYEYTIAEDGTLLESEGEIEVGEIPEAVLAKATAAVPGLVVTEAEKEADGDEEEWTLNGRDAEGRVRIEIEDGEVEVRRRGRGRWGGRNRGPQRGGDEGGATPPPTTGTDGF